MERENLQPDFRPRSLGYRFDIHRRLKGRSIDVGLGLGFVVGLFSGASGFVGVGRDFRDEGGGYFAGSLSGTLGPSPFGNFGLNAGITFDLPDTSWTNLDAQLNAITHQSQSGGFYAGWDYKRDEPKFSPKYSGGVSNNGLPFGLDSPSEHIGMDERRRFNPPPGPVVFTPSGNVPFGPFSPVGDQRPDVGGVPGLPAMPFAAPPPSFTPQPVPSPVAPSPQNAGRPLQTPLQTPLPALPQSVSPSLPISFAPAAASRPPSGSDGGDRAASAGYGPAAPSAGASGGGYSSTPDRAPSPSPRASGGGSSGGGGYSSTPASAPTPTPRPETTSQTHPPGGLTKAAPATPSPATPSAPRSNDVPMSSLNRSGSYGFGGSASSSPSPSSSGKSSSGKSSSASLGQSPRADRPATPAANRVRAAARAASLCCSTLPVMA